MLNTAQRSKKVLIAIVLGIGVLGLVIFVLLNSKVNLSTKRTQTEFTSEEFSLSISSDADFLEIAPDSINYDIFNQWISHMGVPSSRRSFYILEESRRVVPQKVSIVFKDIATLSTQEQEALFNLVISNDKNVVGFRTVYDPDSLNEIEYHIYQSKDLYLEEGEENYAIINTERANREVFELLFTALIGSRYTNKDQHQQARLLAFPEQTDNPMLFLLGSNPNVVRGSNSQEYTQRLKLFAVSLFEYSNKLLVKEVYAQCSGVFLCGVEQNQCSCTVGGGNVTCGQSNQGASCGFGFEGTCVCQPVCYPIVGTNECSETPMCSPSCGSLCVPDGYDNCSYSPAPTQAPDPLCGGFAEIGSCHHNSAGDGCWYLCQSDGNWSGAYGSGCSGSCSNPGDPPPTPTPTDTPSAGDTVITGRIYCAPNGFNVGGVRVNVMNDSSGVMSTAESVNNFSDTLNNYSVNFNYAANRNFAVRSGTNPTVNNGLFTPAGSESVCSPRHEHCPYNSVSGTSQSGFDFYTSQTTAGHNNTCTAQGSRFSWTHNSNAAQYILRVDKLSDPWFTTGSDYFIYLNAGTVCSGSVCSYVLDNTSSPAFDRNESYGWTVQIVDSSGANHCAAGSIYNASACTTSCTATFNPPISIATGESHNVQAYFIPNNGTVDRVIYTSSDSGISFTPSQRSAPSGWQTTMTVSGAPTTDDITVTATGYMDDEGGIMCADSHTYTEISNTPAWWQVYGGSIWSNKLGNGTISSNIPTDIISGYSARLIEDLIPDGPIDVSKGVAATTGNTLSSISPSTDIKTVKGVTRFDDSRYNIDYFLDKLGNPNDTNPINNLSNCINYGSTGYEYCYESGHFTISSDINLGNRKVILIVGGTLTINNKVNLNDGIGFFMAIANDIIIPPALSGTTGAYPPDFDTEPSLEGLFLALDDVEIQGNPASDQDQLRIRGSVVALGHDGGVTNGIKLERSMENNTVGPATVFEFAPDLILRYPNFLTDRNVNWREVSP